MNVSKINESLTLIANFGVIVGIIFLALELNQTNELMESERRFNRLQVVLEGNSAVFENQVVLDATRKAESQEELTENEEIALRFQLSNLFRIWQWTYFELGDTEEFPAEQYRTTMRNNEYLQNAWENRKQRMMPEFVKFMDENILP